MNKLEKIQSESVDEMKEQVEREEEKIEEKKENKFFSLFTFWKKADGEIEPDADATAKESDDVANEKKGIKGFLNLRTGALVASVALIAAAGYLNIKFSSAPEKDFENGVNVSIEDINTALMEQEMDETVNSEEDYFALSVINRQRVRDEALEILLDLTTSEETDAIAKADAYGEMTRIANEITNEANIESLVKAKGFANCIAVVSNDDVNVVVESEGLSINEVAQIKEIVYLECGVHPDNVKIIEKVTAGA